MTKKRLHGQVFTPPLIVQRMLDTAGYVGDTVLTHTLWEPSFGEGVFLVEAVKRIIDASDTPQEARDSIQANIHGVELDADLYATAIRTLETYASSRGVTGVVWGQNLRQGSALDDSLSSTAYDFVVGNPPYVRIHNIPLEDRERVKSYRFTTGITDLYVAFFELGINRLAEGGILAFITPNSFMKNVSQKLFRKFLVDDCLVSELIDYRDTKVFDDADTYATITIIDKRQQNKEITYTLEQANQTQTRTIPYAEINEIAWNFADFNGVESKQRTNPNTFADKLKVQNGILTMRNGVFIDSHPREGVGGTVIFHGYEVESEILRPIVKASKYQGEPVTARVIYPYDEQGDPLAETVLQNKYPKAYSYLLARKGELLTRDADKNAQWYQYGRSQGIKALRGKKYVMSPILHRASKVELFELSEDCIVYGGFFITLFNNADIGTIRAELAKPEFIEYSMLVGKDMAGGYVSIKPLNMKNYRY